MRIIFFTKVTRWEINLDSNQKCQIPKATFPVNYTRSLPVIIPKGSILELDKVIWRLIRYSHQENSEKVFLFLDLGVGIFLFTTPFITQ